MDAPHLPTECLFLIFEFLEEDDLVVAFQVCKTWNALATEERLWKGLVLRWIWPKSLSNALGPRISELKEVGWGALYRQHRTALQLFRRQCMALTREEANNPLQMPASIIAAPRVNWPPLHLLCATYSHADRHAYPFIEELLEKARPSPLCLTSPFPQTAMHVAAEHCSKAVLKLLLAHAKQDFDQPLTTAHEALLHAGKQRLLHYAARGHNIEVISWLIKHGANVKAMDTLTNTPLAYACHISTLAYPENHERILASVRLLVEAGASLRQTGKKSALYTCLEYGSPMVFSYLLEHGAELGNDGSELLMQALRFKNTAIVEILLNANVPLTRLMTREAIYNTLSDAESNVKLQLLRLMLQHGATVDEDTLGCAVKEGCPEVIMLLEKHGLSIDVLRHGREEAFANALGLACAYANSNNVKYILSKCPASDIHEKDWVGNAALHHAVELCTDRARSLAPHNLSQMYALHVAGAAEQENRLKIVQMLLDNGAAIDATNDIGETPLFAAVTGGVLSFVKLLVAKGANVNHVARDETLLMAAIRGGNVKIVYFLLQNGAEVNKVHNGTALHKAATWYRADMVELLISHGADINSDVNGTPIMWCKGYARSLRPGIDRTPDNEETVLALLAAKEPDSGAPAAKYHLSEKLLQDDKADNEPEPRETCVLS